MRFEIQAMIVVEAIDQEDAETRARNLSATLDAEEGPGAFFSQIGVVATHGPVECEEDREIETIPEHVQSIREVV